MEEKLKCLQFKYPIPEKSVHNPRFLINWIRKRSTITTKTRSPICQSLFLLDSKNTWSDSREI